MLPRLLHQFQIHRRTGLRSAIMRIPVVQVATILIIGLCSTKTSGKSIADEENITISPNSEDIDNQEESRDEDLPILPPIILLDFGNNTEDENITSEEKSKRTVNSNLGYGLSHNNLQHTPRRYNYYFPGGKSGTTVSIEESISPFLPKTIIERVQPNRFGHLLNLNNQNQEYQYQNVESISQPVFGLRTKPQKSSQNFEYQSYLTTSKPVSSFAIQNSGSTTQSPLSFGATETVRYVTPGPNFAGSFNYDGQRQQNIQSDINSHGFPSGSRASAESSTISPANYDHYYQSELSNGPRYTYENGVNYENKVFWKYPDGRVSDVPPRTYVETTYAEYPQSSAQQSARLQTTRPIYEASTTENSVLSQGPVQFPTVSGQADGEPNSFVSGESLSTSLPQQQVYRLGYQGLLSQKQNNVAQQRKPGNRQQSYSQVRGTQASKASYHSRYQTLSKYMVNGPNPEYTSSYTTEPTVNATTPLNSLYGSKVQSYLDTVLSGKQESKKQTSNGLNSYSNLQYSDLLSYNPSISEYIRNPSSILNVRPTFVQAGNSLVPVIILRVDGASPIQSRASENINLKALLQQYLIQYAKSIQELAQPSTYNLGTESLPKVNKSPILDLIRLTQEDAHPASSYDSNSYVGQSSYEASNIQETKDFLSSHNQRPTARQKVKSVQILEDPRYTSYKTNN